MKKILIIDDTRVNIVILQELLSKKYDVISQTNGFKAIEIVKNEKVDLILLDVMMPEIDGFETCKILKQNPKTKDIPIFFITAKADEDSIENAYELGGSDYISKPFKPKELLAKINREFSMQDMISHLHYISSYDEMTGILNRRKFFELATKRFDETKENLYAVMIDIDKFKNINDTYGHAFGDKVIKCITNTIKNYLQNKGIFARLGGEEFVILIESLECNNDIETYMEELRVLVSTQTLNTDKNTQISFTISQGISQKDDFIKDIDHLLKKADDALYEAKGDGRNKTIFRV